MRGKTPNPCIACNRYVKWESLLKRSMDIGADYIATGHYARIRLLPDGRYTICNSVTAAKDQTYALYNLTQEQLAHTLMPVGEYTKEEIRELAKKAGLRIANKPDSQEICFVPDGNYASFIEQYTGKKFAQGNFITADGKVIGRHEGIIHYTIGQRRGLRLPMGRRIFVTGIRPETNEVVIGENEELFSKVVRADRLNFMSVPFLEGERPVTAKIRYNHKGAPAKIRMVGEDMVECVFEAPQRAATPGQALVFYDGENVLGGGTIL